jgi:hypothetical protein
MTAGHSAFFVAAVLMWTRSWPIVLALMPPYTSAWAFGQKVETELAAYGD